MAFGAVSMAFLMPRPMPCASPCDAGDSRMESMFTPDGSPVYSKVTRQSSGPLLLAPLQCSLMMLTRSRGARSHQPGLRTSESAENYSDPDDSSAIVAVEPINQGSAKIFSLEHLCCTGFHSISAQ